MIVGDPALRANELLLETKSFHELGLIGLASRARMVAQDALDLIELLDAERSARVALQARCEQQQELLGKRVHDALLEESR